MMIHVLGEMKWHGAIFRFATQDGGQLKNDFWNFQLSSFRLKLTTDD